VDPPTLNVDLPDGRRLDAWVSGPDDATPLVFHHGTPMSGVPFDVFTTAAVDRGLRPVTYSRPGYGGSSRLEERSVAECGTDTAAIIDRLDVGRFYTMGWSGGGPHALACAATLPDRVIACATIAGVAPCPADGIEFLEGMAKENIEEFGLAMSDHNGLVAFLQHEAAAMADSTPEELADVLGDLCPPVDRVALTGAFATFMSEASHEALRPGVWGWFDDDLAFVKPWGFDLRAITVPVTVWQGALDTMVPFAHGEWLAAHIPGARARLFPNEGHLSIAIGAFGDILDDLVGPS